MIGEACYAVMVSGVCVMIHSNENEATAHCSRLLQQSNESDSPK